MSKISATLIVCGFIMVGCHYHETDHDPEALPPPRPAVTQKDTYNLAALDTFPLPVREAFKRDYPESSVTSATVQPVTAGPIQYRIGFVRDGRPQSVVYDLAGVTVTPPAPPRIENRPGMPEDPGPAGPALLPPPAQD